MAADRVASGKNTVDQRGHGRVQRVLIAGRGILMRRSGILENADDLFLGQDVVIVQRKQQGFTDGQRGGSSDIVGSRHDRFRFQLGSNRSDIGWPDSVWMVGAICYTKLIESSLRCFNSAYLHLELLAAYLA